MLKNSQKTYLQNSMEDLAGVMLAVWFFERITIELTTLGESLHFVSVVIFHAGRFCGVLALTLMAALAVRNGTFRLKRTWVVLLVGILSALGGAQTYMLELAVLVIGIRNFDLEKLFRRLFAALLCGTVFIMALGAAGIITAKTIERGDGTIRQAFGFYHPNTLGMRLFQIASMNLLLRTRKKIRFADAAFALLLGLFVLKAAHSRTSSLLLFGIGFLAFGVMALEAETGTRGRHRPLTGLAGFASIGAFLIPAAAVFGFLWLGQYGDDSMFDSTIWSRISQSAAYLREYGISPFGRALYYREGALRTGMESLYTLDNGYMYLLLGFGIPAFLLFLTGQIVLVIKTFLERRWMHFVILLLYMAYLMMETTPLRVDCNFLLLMLTEVLYMRKREETEEKFEYITDRA